MSINKVLLCGNLTRDPELRATATGTQALTFGIAVNDRIKNNQTGQWEDRPNYVDCVMFGNRAESVSRFIHKGSKVSIEGKLSWSQWQDKQTGQNRSNLKVVVNEIEFMQANQQSPAYQQPAQYQPAPQYQPLQAPAPQPQYQPAPQPQYQPSQAPVQQPPMAQQPMPPAVNPSLYDEDIPF